MATNPRRKISFLGFAPTQAELVEDEAGEVQLDEEMERGVWQNAPRETSQGEPPTYEHAIDKSVLASARREQDSLSPPTASAEHAAAAFGTGGTGNGPAVVTAATGDHVTATATAGREQDSSGRARAVRAERKFSLQESSPQRTGGWQQSEGEGGREGEGGMPPWSASYDPLEPHEAPGVFVQLSELSAEGGGGEGGGAVWREVGRWIKYEEAVEEGAGRWGRPHVAPLSFHSLLNLRRCLDTGFVDMEAQVSSMSSLADAVCSGARRLGLADDAECAALRRALLLPHRHVGGAGGRLRSSYTSLQSLRWAERAAPAAGPAPIPPIPPNLFDKRRRSSYALPADTRKKSLGAGAAPNALERAALLETGTAAGAVEATGAGGVRRDSILHRVPAGAEAALVLVGETAAGAGAPVAALLRLSHAAPLPGATEVPLPVRLVFVLLGPRDPDVDRREVGRALGTLLANPAFLAVARRAPDARLLLSALNEFLDESIVLPPGEWESRELLPLDELRAKGEAIRRRKRDALRRRSRAASLKLSGDEKALLAAEAGGAGETLDSGGRSDGDEPDEPEDPLTRTGKLFGGVIRDVRRRYPHYASDFRDALNGQCAAATIFMYFAALSSAITFGGLLADKTMGQIGISETLLFTSVGGMVFALVSGQPLMITGATGPLLLLDTALAEYCRGAQLDFLAVRMYAGFWMVAIALLVAALEGSVAVKMITRFTEDIFACLISLIFISEPVTALVNVYRAHPLGADYCQRAGAGNATSGESPPPPMTPQPNTALFCTMLTLGTFTIAYYLRIFRNGKFLGRGARRALGDFGVPIAIVVMVGAAALVPVWTDTLRVPAGLRPTLARPWLVTQWPATGHTPLWAALAAALPALMVYIIVFMETHIAELIVAKPERKLQKGSGFHMDIVVMSLVNCVCGVFGAPWQCVATVRSVSHVAALTVMSRTHAPGERPRVLGALEQRLTALVVSALVGLSVLAAGALRRVPMAVLFGVFLYMGVSALGGIQLWQRCVLLLRPVKHHGSAPYARRVPTGRMHLFTLLQLGGLAVLYAVKSSPLSLALPFFLIMMVPLRRAIGMLFTHKQLHALDGDQQDVDKDDEPDFYEEAPLP